MAMRRTTVVGVFSDRNMAEHAVDELKDSGFSNDEIRYSGATAGGSFIDNLKSWFSGEEPASQGDVAADLKNIGLPEDEAGYYAREYAAGHPIVAVRSPGREAEAMAVLRSNGSFQVAPGATGEEFNQSAVLGKVQDYSESSQYESQAGYTGPAEMRQGVGYERPTGPAGGINEPSVPPQSVDTGMAGRDAGTIDEQGQSMRLREEQLRVEKQRVQKGEVRVHKEIIEEQQTVDVPVRREEVVIERRPIIEPQPTDTPVGQDETIRVPVSEEQVTVTKQPVETEEITLKKRQVEEQKRARGTVRREEARIEPTGDISQQDLSQQNLSDEERRP